MLSLLARRKHATQLFVFEMFRTYSAFESR